MPSDVPFLLLNDWISNALLTLVITVNCYIQEIDELLATNLSQEDEDAVLNELAEIEKVKHHIMLSLFGHPPIQCPLVFTSPPTTQFPQLPLPP